MSSIYKNGEWWYYQSSLKTPEGKTVRIQKSLKTRDKKEGLKRQREWDNKLLTQQINLGFRIVLQSKVEEYLTDRRDLLSRGELTQNTIRSDVGSLKNFSKFCEVERYKYLNEFEDRDKSREILESFIKSRLDNKVSPNTIRRDLRHVSGFFTWCVKPPRRLLSFNPISEVSLPKKTRHEKFPEEKEWLKLREYLRSKIATKSSTLVEQIVWFQLETGSRIGEILRLKWERETTDKVGTGESWSVVENEFGSIRLYSKRRERILPLSSFSEGRLTKFLKSMKRSSSSKYVFPSPVTERPLNVSQFSRSFKKLLATTGVKGVFGTHGVRHGFISFSLNNGLTSDQIGLLVGHSSSEITRIYLHPDKDTLGKIVAVLG